tara:strand:- start:10856 stop:11296 length:441 start_codon:yes stop_codon:yes gene_type:complete
MNNKFNFEFLLGILILLITAYFFINFLIKSSVFENKNKFSLQSNFFDIGNLQIGSDVKIKGVIIGEVNEISLNLDNFMANVKTTYHHYIDIPIDSSFKISNEGFIGSSFIEISIGNNDLFFNNMDSTINNIDAISLEEIINNFIFN